MVYLALYKGRKRVDLKNPKTLWWRFADAVVRTFTRSKYSHCEFAVRRQIVHSHSDIETYFEAYSSSLREGGVRKKRIEEMTLRDETNWELIHIPSLTPSNVESYYAKTKGTPYDFFGAIGIIVGLKHARSKFFCSEWCYNLLANSENGWRFSPADLKAITRDFKPTWKL